LWSQSVGVVEVTRLERRPVDPEEVRPPATILDLKSWNASGEAAADASSGSQADVTVTMESVRDTLNAYAVRRRVVRRHHPWNYTEEVLTDGRRHLSIFNESQGLSFYIQISANNEFTRLNIWRSPPQPAAGSPPVKLKPIKTDRTEPNLGETCTWFNMTPNMADAGLAQCKTDDGLVLKEKRWARGGDIPPLEAVRLERGPVALTDVLPPPEVLTRRIWGLPD
jgi:hypothetical protein